MYTGVRSIFSRYWRSYGGLGALVRSPYLHLAFVLLLVTSHFWSMEKWWEQPLSILPNLLGFSLGGLAMFLSFGDERFRSILTEHTAADEPSPYMELCSSFVHFIALQICALMFALVAKSIDFQFPWPAEYRPIVSVFTVIFSGMGYLLFLYSVSAMLAATMSVFRICSWYELHQKNKPSHDD